MPDRGTETQAGLPAGLRELPVDHVAIAVEDLAAGAEPYRLLGLSEGEPETLPEQGVRVLMLRAGAVKLELIEPTGPDTAVGRFLAKRGPGLHHLALRVESMEAAVGWLREAGARFTQQEPRRGHGGSLVIFLHPSWTGGVLIELVEHAPEPHGGGGTRPGGEGDG